MATKNSIEKRRISQVSLSKRAAFSRTSNVTIVYWHWNKENFGTSSNVQMEAAEKELIGMGKEFTKGYINTDVSSCSISKNIDNPSASFNISLLPTKNWRQVIAPGDWIAIYFHSEMSAPEPDSTKNMVLIGNIDRVSRTIQKDEETDTTQLRYSITGRNFGKVFEQTDIWYDPYTNQTATLDVMLRQAGLEITGNPSQQVEAALNVFLGEGQTFKGGKTSALNQWMIPRGVSNLFGAKDKRGFFDGILKRAITQKLPGYNPRNLLALNSNGNLWDFIKRSSNQLVNEVYLEETRDSEGNVKPTIHMGPRPTNTPFFHSQFGDEKSVIPLIKYKTLQELSTENYVEISQSEIIYEDLGRDDHSRINMVWLETSQAFMGYLSPTANVDGANTLGNPTFSRPSIQRNGLRRLDAMLEFCHSEQEGGVITTDLKLYKAFIGQLYDMNYANHLYEQGTIECSGVLEAELGKALVVKSALNQKDKIYFIEGYEHKWNFPNTWTTVFTVTKGQFRDTAKPFIDILGPGDFGQADNSIDLTFSAKTKGNK